MERVLNRLASLLLSLALCVGMIVPLTGAGYSRTVIIDRIANEGTVAVTVITDGGMTASSEAQRESTPFAVMLAEAEKQLGTRYAWGGTMPSSGFDCSGFVSWVLNHSGWNVGRLGAHALYDICEPVSRSEAKPGDLVFFTKTYRAARPSCPVTHVGIYTGDGAFIHCGTSIGVTYASLGNSYWKAHYYGTGRLPQQNLSEGGGPVA